MEVVSLCAQKGGVGKTTLALHLALQLRPAFEVSLLCGGLMDAAPSGPRQDEGWLNAPLRQPNRHAEVSPNVGDDGRGQAATA